MLLGLCLVTTITIVVTPKFSRFYRFASIASFSNGTLVRAILDWSWFRGTTCQQNSSTTVKMAVFRTLNTIGCLDVFVSFPSRNRMELIERPNSFLDH